jgi:hypothetical protein
MRHFLLALLIVLLPVRGWMVDAMAMALMTQPGTGHSVAQTPAPHCAEHAAAGEAAHLGHTPVHSQAPEHPAPGTHSDVAHQHQVCDVCNGPALALSLWHPFALHQPHSLQANPVVRFASTVLPKGIKPPIS